MIELKKLTAGYGKNTVVENISLILQTGETMALLGINGSGKSTLLKTIAGILPPLQGTVCINGMDIAKCPQRELARKISYLSQINNRTGLTVRQVVLHGRYPYLSFPRQYRKEDRETVEEAIRTVGLEKEGDTPVSRLSGGNLQKAYIAMSLAQETDIILLDEPTTFLDIKSQLQIAAMIKELSHRGKTVIMILHDIPLALKYADRIAILHEGKLLTAGTPDEILKSGAVKHVFGIDIRKVIFDGQSGYLCVNGDTTQFR